jgi:diguanylate cyclase (GGDEF)-like protein
VLDTDGVVSACDPEAARILSRAAADVIGTAAGALFIGGLPAAVADAVRAAPSPTTPSTPPRTLRVELTLVANSNTGNNDDNGASRSFPTAVELTFTPAPATTRQAAGTLTFHDVSARRLADRLHAAEGEVISVLAEGQSSALAGERLLGAIGTAMGWQLGAQWACNPGGELDRVATWSGASADVDAPALPERLTVEGTLAGRALVANHTEWTIELPELVGLSAAVVQANGWRSAIAVPLARGGEPSGVITFLSTADAPDAMTLQALDAAGARIGELLTILDERQTRIERLARLALTDELTGLPNRRAWEEMLVRELARAARTAEPVCVAVLDLDRFKTFNDTHGHQAGDRLLHDVAQAWQRQLRLSDLIARYGGEEFAAIIPAWPAQTAAAVVERLRRATPGALTASAGVASWDGTETGAELFARADAALYAAKQTGRNRTVAAPDTTRTVTDAAAAHVTLRATQSPRSAPARLPRAS